MVEIFKVLGDENRLRMLNILLKAELCVCEIEVILDLSQSNVSRHLNKLKQMGILLSNKDAQWIHYSVKESFLKDHKELVAFMGKAFLEGQYRKDMQVLKNYQEKALTCTDIRAHKAIVIEEIFN